MIRRFIKILFIVFFLFTTGYYFNRYRQSIGESKSFKSVGFEVGETFIISPTEINPEIFRGPPWPKVKRPDNVAGYLIEYLRDKKTIKGENLGPVYYASKRVMVLEQLGDQSSMLGNYENIEQLNNWWRINRPKDWQFWRFSEFDSWEAGFAEIFVSMNEEINRILLDKQTKKEMERLIETRRALLIFDERLTKAIDNLSETEEKIKYLSNMKDETFSYLENKIVAKIPKYNSSDYFYNLKFLVDNGETGIYEMLLLPFDLESQQSGFKFGKQFEKKFFIGKEKSVSLGEFVFDASSEWAILSPERKILQEGEKTGVLPKIKLEKIGLPGNGVQKESVTELKKGIPKELYLLAGLASFLFSLYLTPKMLNFNVKNLLKKLSKNLFIAIVKFYRRRKVLFFLIYAGLVLYMLFFSENFFDSVLLLTIIVWMIIGEGESLGSLYSFFISFVIISTGPIFIVSQKEITTEMISLAAFMFMTAGIVQQFAYLGREPKGRIDFEKLYLKTRLKYFFFILSLFFLAFLLKSLKGELAFYEYFFEDMYLSEFIYRVLWKIILFPVVIIVLFYFKVFKQFTPNFIRSKFERYTLFFSAALIIIFIGNKILFLNEREKFSSKPYITEVVIGAQDVQIFGHNFHDIPFIGKVYLNGVELVIKEWKDWRITVKLGENFRQEGKLYVVNQYDDYNDIWFTSNYYKMKTE